jgi:hypothetical protein
MAQKIRIHRTAAPNKPPTNLDPGELSIEMRNPTRLWVGVPTDIDPSGKKLLLDVTAVHAATAATTQEPPSNPNQGALWYETDTGILWLYYDDGNTQQWVQVNGVSVTGGGIPLGNVVGPITAAAGNVALFADTSGKVLLDGGPAASGNVVGPASSVADHIAVFAGATGKVLKDSGVVPVLFAAGTAMIFANAAAPVGWTKRTDVNNKALRVITGTTGGALAGSVAFSTLFGRTGTDTTTLVAATVPQTYAGVLGVNKAGSSSPPISSVSSDSFWGGGTDYEFSFTKYIYNNGAGLAHSHNIDMRVAYVDVIIATKD